MTPTGPPPPYPVHSPKRRPRRPLAWTIAEIRGIEIKVHVSFLLLVALVAVSASAPGQPAVVVQVAWIAILFACVVVHELAHSFTARAHGVDVHEIELLPIGGVSKLESSPRRPHDELVIAAAGPLASLAVAGLVAAVATVAGAHPWPVSIYGGALVTRVVWVNVLLAGFNLIPALPLDGGRVLRAALTPRLGHVRATRAAALAGRGVAAVFVAVGLVWNFWLAAIGIFVWLGAIGEEAAAAAASASEDPFGRPGERSRHAGQGW